MSPSPSRLPRSAALFIGVLTAMAVALTALALAGAPAVGRPSAAGVVLCLAVMAAEWPTRALLKAVGEPNPWVFLGPLVVWLLGTPLALLVGVAAILGTCALDRAPLRKWLFNGSVRTLAVLAAAWVLAAVGGHAPPVPAEHVSRTAGLLAMLVAQAVWWSVGWTAVSVVVALTERRSLLREFTRDALVDLRNSFLFAVTGPVVLLALAYQPLVLPFLALPVVGAVGSAQRAFRRRLEARTDALTGLPNRVAIYEETREALRQAEQRGGSAAVALIDLNGFKPINDTYGHEAGDAVLRVVGERLERVAAEEGCLAGRLGGDEFIVLWRDHAPAGEYRARGATVRAALRERLELPEGLIALDGSVGVAVFPHDAGDLRSLLGRADEAMYRAKSAGGGVVLASDEPSATSTLAAAGATVE